MKSLSALGLVDADDVPDTYTALPLIPPMSLWRWARLWLSWQPGSRLTNRLRLNPSMIRFIWLGTRKQLAKLDLVTIAADFLILSFPLLSGILKSRWSPPSLHLSTSSAVISTALHSVTHSWITARLDNCNKLYVDLPVAVWVPVLDPTFCCTPLRTHPKMVSCLHSPATGYMLDVHRSPSNGGSRTGSLLSNQIKSNQYSFN